MSASGYLDSLSVEEWAELRETAVEVMADGLVALGAGHKSLAVRVDQAALLAAVVANVVEEYELHRYTERRLNAITGGDPDGDHGYADDLLLAAVPGFVRDAYKALVGRATWWATA